MVRLTTEVVFSTCGKRQMNQSICNELFTDL